MQRKKYNNEEMTEKSAENKENDENHRNKVGKGAEIVKILTSITNLQNMDSNSFCVLKEPLSSKTDYSPNYWQNAFSQKVNPSSAFVNYILCINQIPNCILRPQQTLGLTSFGSALLTAPIAIPAALVTAPMFFAARSTYQLYNFVQNDFEKRNTKNIEEKYNKNYRDDTLSHQTLIKAISTAIADSLENKGRKRIVIVYEAKIKGGIPKSKKVNQQNKIQQDDSKEFIFIMNLELELRQLFKRVKREIKLERQSLHFFSGTKLLNPNTQVCELPRHKQGVSRVVYAKVETFG